MNDETDTPSTRNVRRRLNVPYTEGLFVQGDDTYPVEVPDSPRAFESWHTVQQALPDPWQTPSYPQVLQHSAEIAYSPRAMRAFRAAGLSARQAAKRSAARLRDDDLRDLEDYARYVAAVLGFARLLRARPSPGAA